MFNVSTVSSFTSSKKLVQSKISTYFKELKGIPQDANDDLRRQKMKGSLTSSSSSCSSGQKRKLAVQIFSEDEDSDCEFGNERTSSFPNRTNTLTTPIKKAKSTDSSNKDTCHKKSPQKLFANWRPCCTSTPSVISNGTALPTNTDFKPKNTDSTHIQILNKEKAKLNVVNNLIGRNYSRLKDNSDSDESDVPVKQNICILRHTIVSNFHKRDTDPCCSKTLTNNNIERCNTLNKNLDKPKNNLTEPIKNTLSEERNGDPCCSKTLTNSKVKVCGTLNKNLIKPKNLTKRKYTKKNTPVKKTLSEERNESTSSSKTLTNSNAEVRASLNNNLVTPKNLPKRKYTKKNTPAKKPLPEERNGDASCSKTVTPVKIKDQGVPKKNLSSDSDKLDENSNMDKKAKIKVLKNIVISPAKNVTTNNVSNSKESSMKDEDKKLNFRYVDVMKDFFFNVVNMSSLKCLLKNNHREILETFFKTDRNYQYTCIKLFMWKPIWYNIFKYVERIGLKMNNGEVIAMYNCLKNNAFVETDYLEEDIFTLLDLLTIKDLREIQRNFKIVSTSNNREAVINRLIKNCKTQVTLPGCAKSTEQILKVRIQEKLGFCCKLTQEFTDALYNIYLLNTFTNPSFAKPQEYFRSINDVVFPSYKMENYSIFYTPEEFSKYALAIQLRNALETAVEKKDASQIYEICKGAYNMLQENDESAFDSSRAQHLEKFSASAQYTSILSSGVKYITSSAHNEVRVWLEYLLSRKFCSFKRGDWYCHLSLIYTTYLKQYETAAKCLISALEKDKEHFSEIQLHELASRGKILDKKTYKLPTLYHDQLAALSPACCDRDWPQKVVESKTMRSNAPGQKRKYVQECENGDVNYLSVEQTALEDYRNSGYLEGEHCEGSIICACFCLFFWDIIYDTYVRGTFVSKVQNAPLDMYTKYFYSNRQSLIQNRLREIRSDWKEEELKAFLFEKWDLHSHESTLCPIENVINSRERLFSIILCIGRSILSRIFERLVTNFKVYHSGFPDLIVWNTSLKKAKFVEVKGENDTLSIKQKLWINYLLDIGADAEVCHVHSTGSKKKQVKSRATNKNQL